MSLTDQSEFQDGFLRGYLAGDQTISGNIPTVLDRPGPIGDPGPQGPANTVTGLPGDPGIDGLQGPIGFTGDQGLQGDTGLTGIDGIQGLPGTKGPIGDTGAQGVKGDTGIAGPVGLAQRLLTDIQFYNNGFMATYSDLYVSMCTVVKDASSRIILITDSTPNPDDVTIVNYNIGNRP